MFPALHFLFNFFFNKTGVFENSRDNSHYFARSEGFHERRTGLSCQVIFYLLNRSKAMLLLWFILIVIRLPLAFCSLCLG